MYRQHSPKNKKFGLSRASLGLLFIWTSSLLTWLINTRYIHRVLREQEGHVPVKQRPQQQQQQQQQQPQPQPQQTLLSDLLHLYQTLPKVRTVPNETFPNITYTHPIQPFRVLAYAIPRELEVNFACITLTTQASVSRLPRLLQLVDRWRGPVSCVVHLPDEADIHSFFSFVQAQNRMFRFLVTFHVILERPSEHFYYPINRMRNIAIQNSDTELFFLCDVDFMPRENAFHHVMEFIVTNTDASEKFKKLYIMPAFEVFGEGTPEDIAENVTVKSLKEVPKNKTQLLSMWDERKLAPFHIDYNEAGQSPTKFEKWRKNCPANSSYPITYKWRFEPYVLGARDGIPIFNERLRGFGLNKAAWVAEAHLQGYKFEVLCDHFVVHMNHPGRKYRNAGKNRKNIRWFQMKYLAARYDLSHAVFNEEGKIEQL